jgi:secreted trypsin-like serine protease
MKIFGGGVILFATGLWLIASEAQTPLNQARLGPESLYPTISPKTTDAQDIPLVIQDAVDTISGKPRVLNIEPRIIGGTLAPIGAYPWQVSIGISGQPQIYGHFCGGSLVGPNWIVTAAHCVYGQTAPEHLQVLTGTNFLNQGGEIHLVDQIVVNEGWSSTTFDHDVAILHLPEAVHQNPISLVSPQDADRLARPGLIALVSGWGLTRESGSQVSNVLRNVSVQLVTKQDCSGTASYPGAITDTMICAGFAEGGKDGCQGDSGGPLIVPNLSGGFALAGIVSWGEGCGRPGKYGVYTFVPSVQQWLDNAIKLR